MTILVKLLKNCKSYVHLHDRVSAFTEHVFMEYVSYEPMH